VLKSFPIIEYLSISPLSLTIQGFLNILTVSLNLWGWALCCPELWRSRQKDHKFEVSPGCRERSCLKKIKNQVIEYMYPFLKYMNAYSTWDYKRNKF
jgi:hypothetical protein